MGWLITCSAISTHAFWVIYLKFKTSFGWRFSGGFKPQTTAIPTFDQLRFPIKSVILPLKMGVIKTVQFFAPSAQQLIHDLRRHREDPRQHFLGLCEWGDPLPPVSTRRSISLAIVRTTLNQLLIYFSFSLENVTPRTIQNSLYLLFDKILSQPVFPF